MKTYKCLLIRGYTLENRKDSDGYEETVIRGNSYNVSLIVFKSSSIDPVEFYGILREEESRYRGSLVSMDTVEYLQDTVKLMEKDAHIFLKFV